MAGSVSPGFRMPAEWEPHHATWIGWPHNASDWPGKLTPIQWVYGEIVRKLVPGEIELCRRYVDEVIAVDTDALCAAIKDVFQDTRSILEPAGALAIAGAKAYVERDKIKHKTMVAIACGANMNFDRLRFVAFVSCFEHATFDGADLHGLEVIGTDNVPIINILRRRIGCLLIAFDLRVVSINAPQRWQTSGKCSRFNPGQ